MSAQSNAKRDKNNLISGKKKKPTIKTQVVIEQEKPKIIATSFRSEKTAVMLYLKNQKNQFLKYQINSWWWLSKDTKNHNNVLI
ncbi:hypothetical protein [Spiroplasma poulsonii]|uniref:hypothetical protein n=1 Tax=Spiroplasma poulsonii TaxID=2138 RepID=UPI001F4C9E92|nr:hypothetical protein [Spiroplasma poulsonii]UNF61332.1 hypothetical protein MNU24_05300 [Spiroplasma poulsonii]